MLQDAAYIVEAAVVAQTLPCHVKREGGSAITESGMVYVHGADFRRLRDGMSWTDGRNLGNGFNVYREKASSPMNALTEAELVSISLYPSVFPSHTSRLALSQR